MFGRKKVTYHSLGDEELMRLSAKGERGAFEAIYDRYFNKLVWFARSFVNDEARAQDLVQDVFIKLIEQPGRFDSSKRFSTWVYVVTANLCRQNLRNDKNRQRIIEENHGHQVVPPDFDAQADRKLLKQQLRTACEGLNDKEKQIYALRFEEEASIREIAEILEIPEGSVKSGNLLLTEKTIAPIKGF